MKIDLLHSKLVLRDDGIIQLNSTDHNYILKDLKEINAAHGKLCYGKRTPLLVIASEFANIDSESREYMASPESTQYSLAEAYVIKALGQKILANFYLKVNKPSVPTRIFTDIKLAEEWLFNYLPSDL